TLGRGANQELIVGIGDDGRRCARTFRDFDELVLAAFHHGNAAVRGAEVDTVDLAPVCSPFKNVLICRPNLPDSIMGFSEAGSSAEPQLFALDTITSAGRMMRSCRA